jgi:hypothetical protein
VIFLLGVNFCWNRVASLTSGRLFLHLQNLELGRRLFLKDVLFKVGQGSNGQKVHDRPFTKE